MYHLKECTLTLQGPDLGPGMSAWNVKTTMGSGG